ncbi:MAG: DHH family phosphoesterase [bacterium]
MENFEKLEKIIDENENFLLIGHEKPDGDSIGSLLAFNAVLSRSKRTVSMLLKDKIPTVYHFLEGVELISSIFPSEVPEVIILLDNGDMRRTGFSAEILMAQKKGAIIVNIDHHQRNDIWKIANLNLVNENYSSTCEILLEIIENMQVEINSRIATALLTGLHNDTGGFRHSNTSISVLNAASNLLKKGAKLKKISENTAISHTVAMLKLWGIALDRLRVSAEGISYSILTLTDISNAEATEDDVAGLVNLLNTVPESKIALLLYETFDGKIRGSLRTESDSIDISILANILGGGGHKKAAGFTIEGKFEKLNNQWKIV